MISQLMAVTGVPNYTDLLFAKHTLLSYIVGELKSRIVQKHTFFAPERYTVGILYTDSLNGA